MSGQPVEAEEVRVILDALCARPCTKALLSRATGISPRHVECVISHIRREGILLVASGPDGYWLPATLDEAEANIERRHSRAIHMMETLQGERALLRRMREAAMPERVERLSVWAAA